MNARTPYRLLVALIAVLFIAGCSGLPTEGPVRAGQDVDSQDNGERVVAEPEPPEPGADMENIAQGFLRAHIGVGEGFETARDYLAGEAAEAWDPDQGILVLESLNFNPRRATGSQIVVSARAVAEVDEQGHLTELPTQQRRQLALGMELIHGQWRITSVPADLGLWVSINDFERNYQPRPVYFAAERGPTPTALIPDVRWLPDGGLATALARAVIGPPPEWLEQTVRRPVPASTRLQPGLVSVSADTRVATVTLSRDALEASPQDRKALWASMMQTVGQVQGVSRVEIKVGDSLLQTTGIDGVPTIDRLGYSVGEAPQGPVVLRQDGELAWVPSLRGDDRESGGGPSASSLEGLPSVTAGWDQLAVDASGREVAGISGDRTQLGRWVDEELTARTSFGADLVRPVYDGRRGLWLAGRSLGAVRPQEKSEGTKPDESPKRAEGPPTIWVLDTRQPVAEAELDPVSAPWLGTREVVAIAVSPEAHRVALVVRDRNGRTALLLSSVVRDKNGDVDSLAQPVESNPSVQDPTSVSWVDPVTVAVIGRPSAAQVEQPIKVPVGGLAVALGEVKGAERVVGNQLPQDGIFVVTDRDTVLHRLGRSWDQVATAEDLVAPPSS